MAWEWVNATSNLTDAEFALPADLETTASLAEVTYRAKAKPWTVCVFMLLTAILLIWCNTIVLWILSQQTTSPNLSDFVEVDISAKASHSRLVQEQENNEDKDEVEEFTSMLRRQGLGNAESSAVLQSLREKRLRVAAVDNADVGCKSLVLVTASEGDKGLEEAQSLGVLQRGKIYG